MRILESRKHRNDQRIMFGKSVKMSQIRFSGNVNYGFDFPQSPFSLPRVRISGIEISTQAEQCINLISIASFN